MPHSVLAAEKNLARCAPMVWQWKFVDCYGILCLVVKRWRLLAAFFGKLVVSLKGSRPGVECRQKVAHLRFGFESLACASGWLDQQSSARIMRIMAEGNFRSQVNGR